MEKILKEIKPDKGFENKRLELISYSEKLKNYSGKKINQFTIKGINKHINLIKYFLKINKGMQTFMTNLKEVDGEVGKVDFV